MEILLNLLLVLLLVLMNAFFVAAEFSTVKVRKSRVETLVMEGNNGARYALKVVNSLNEYLSACQLGITLASLGLGWIGEPAIADMIRPIFVWMGLSDLAVHTVAFALAFSIITGMHIVLGELVPKSLAIVSAEKIALVCSMPLIGFYRLTYPIMLLFNKSTELFLGLFGISMADEHDEIHTDAEIMLLVEERYKHGLIDKTELSLMDNIFDFSEKVAREIMVPRTDMVCFSQTDTIEEMLTKAMTEDLTRYPVFVNDKDNIIGFVHIKDLYKQRLQEDAPSVEAIVRELKAVPETMSISALFKEMQKEKAQMALVIDEYGGTAGIVTIEDILEEIVGEIRDEFDDDREDVERIGETSYSVSGRLLIEAFNERFQMDIFAEDVDTVGGWLIHQLGTVPKPGDRVELEGVSLLVTQCGHKRIDRLTVTDHRKDITLESED